MRAITITRTSMLTGVERSRTLRICPEQLEAYENGSLLLQDAFPHLPADDREFIKTGITPEEWFRYMGEED